MPATTTARAPREFAITHRTGFEYQGEVIQSYNLARLTPAALGGQLLVDHSITIAPSSETFAFTDYWGTRVHSFSVHVPHRRLEITARSVVRAGHHTPAPTDEIDWDALYDPRLRDELCELLAPSTLTQPDDTSASLAAQLRAGRSPRETVTAIIDWIRTEVRYERGVTNTHTAAAGVLAARRGVCQDFAHLAITLLRSAGIPARYVSGYVHPDDDASIGASLAGESHAWIDVWIGHWWPVDPTHDQPVTGRHIRVAHGRDYNDVAPLVGIYTGAPSKALHVSVELTRVA